MDDHTSKQTCDQIAKIARVGDLLKFGQEIALVNADQQKLLEKEKNHE